MLGRPVVVAEAPAPDVLVAGAVADEEPEEGGPRFGLWLRPDPELLDPELLEPDDEEEPDPELLEPDDEFPPKGSWY